MNNLKGIFAALALTVGLLGIASEFANKGMPKASANLGGLPSTTAKPNTGLGSEAGGVKPVALGMHEFLGIDARPALKAKQLPGIFRGDWGEIPVYAHHDQVTYQGAAYLSLMDGNQNHPPALNVAFWRKIKKATAGNEAACTIPVPHAKLTGCDFTGDDALKDKDLSGADLTNARLNGNLGSANLSHANLNGAAVIGALTIAQDTRIDHANLSGLQSGGNNPLIAESVDMDNVNFAGANLYGARMEGAKLNGANFTGATLTGADLASSRLQNADLSHTDLTYANLSAGYLVSAALDQADLTQANLSGADLTQATLHHANLAGTNLTGANLSGADLRGANLTAVQGADSALIDGRTEFTSAICPDGATVDGVRVVNCVGHGF